MSAAPAPYPCASCPYRKDVPSGVWHESEYDKLAAYDFNLPLSAFFCHQRNGKLCSGWVGCHNMDNSMALRMAASVGAISPEDYEAALDYEPPIELFESGAAAAEHGKAEIETPSTKARRTISKLERRRERRDQ